MQERAEFKRLSPLCIAQTVELDQTSQSDEIIGELSVMESDDVALAICSSGAAAIREVRQMAAVTQDNEIREETISASIARNLHRKLGAIARTEMLYSDIANQLGMTLTAESAISMGGLMADVVIFDGTTRDAKPILILEVKKFAEKRRASDIVADLHEAHAIFSNNEIAIAVGVMVCETGTQKLQDRGVSLRHSAWSATFSAPEYSINKEWRWSFGCLFWKPSDQ